MQSSNIKKIDKPLPCAVIYVRSATCERKQVNQQIATIRDYATRHRLKIIGSHIDCGKPGNGLENMMATVKSGKADFSVILMRDPARWGRYPDADMHSYYEYLCRRAGIDIHYVEFEDFPLQSPFLSEGQDCVG